MTLLPVVYALRNDRSRYIVAAIGIVFVAIIILAELRII